MTILAIDPGPIDSAYVVLRDGEPINFGKVDNEWLLGKIESGSGVFGDAEQLAIEMIASYGMPVGKEVFDTCVCVGRIVQAWNHYANHYAIKQRPHSLVYRKDVKMHLCHSMRAKDSNVRAALIDKFGGKAKALGSRMARGPLHGISGDCWSALAVGVYHAETSHAQ